MDYASELRVARKQAGLSQSQLAQLAGTSQPAVARYELGHASPTTRTLARLLEVCHDHRAPGDRRSRHPAPYAPLWSSSPVVLEDRWFIRQLASPGDQPTMAAALRGKWRARGVDMDRLAEVIYISADQRLQRLEDFVSDMRAVRSATTAARRR